MVSSRRSASPHDRFACESGGDGGVVMVTQPPSTVFQTQVSGDGTQDSSTMMHLKVQLGPGEHDALRGRKSAEIKAQGLVVAELFRFDWSRVPVYCPVRESMVGLRVPQAVFEFDVDRTRPEMTLRCRRKHLPVSKNYGGCPFRFVLHFEATGAVACTEPFMIASKQPQPKHEPKRKRNPSDFLPRPDPDSERDVRIRQALVKLRGSGGAAAAGGGGGGSSLSSSSSSSSSASAGSAGSGLVLSRYGEDPSRMPHLERVPPCMPRSAGRSGHGGTGAAPRLAPRKRRRVSVCPEPSVMGGGEACGSHDGSVSIPVGSLGDVGEPATMLAQLLVHSSSSSSSSSSSTSSMAPAADGGTRCVGASFASVGVGGMAAGIVLPGVGVSGVGLGFGLGGLASSSSFRKSSLADVAEAGQGPGMGGRDGDGSTASGSRSPASRGEAEMEDVGMAGLDCFGHGADEDVASVAGSVGGDGEGGGSAGAALGVSLPRTVLVPGASVGAPGSSMGRVSSSGFPTSSPLVHGRLTMQDSCASVVMED